jgi:hypothetical protein
VATNVEDDHVCEGNGAPVFKRKMDAVARMITHTAPPENHQKTILRLPDRDWHSDAGHETDASRGLSASPLSAASSCVGSFLDRAANGPQVLTKGQVRISLPVLEERRELDLLPKGVPAPDSLSLPPLGVSDSFGNVEDLGNTVIGEEDGSIVVCEDNVAGADRVLADAGRHECLRVARRQLQRSGRDRAHAEHWQPNREDVRGVPVQAPHEEPCNTRGSRFGDDKITDARLVGASTVVDDEHVSFARVLERFEEHVDAAGVPSGQHSACDPSPRRERTRPGRCASHWYVEADAGVREMRGRQRREPRRVVGVHALTVTSHRTP